MASTKPTILFIPGLWEGTSVFTPVRNLLSSFGYITQTAPLPSTGTLSPGNPSMDDDIASLHTAISSIIQEDREVLLVLHSAGGFLGSSAMEGLSVKHRKEKGLKGGVVEIVFLSTGLLQPGNVLKNQPFMDFENAPPGGMTCISPCQLLFTDFSDSKADEWMKKLRHQPAKGWQCTIKYCGWQDAPSTYLVCEKDQALPVQIQEQCAEMAGSKIERCGAGHMVMLSMPEKVVDVIRGVVES